MKDMYWNEYKDVKSEMMCSIYKHVLTVVRLIKWIDTWREGDMSIKGFCNETRLEEAMAASPSSPEEGLCPVSQLQIRCVWLQKLEVVLLFFCSLAEVSPQCNNNS